ncbi:unnamed protein product [Prorocentrum cordatum]|uniref:Pentatricopeptide repeat-containing protein n=1 Tax=Prorocentrum cordatum TaxID=2364126 RepID=A0ABN9R6C2_9DINO|nr:unnamed protein product [Polarella glacialis]
MRPDPTVAPSPALLYQRSLVPRATPSRSGITCNTALGACSRAAEWSAAVLLLRDMPRRRLRADAVSFSTCITAGHKAGRWDLAAGLLADMRGRRVAPNIITFNASVTALTAGQQWESAVSLLGDMQEVRLQPDLCPYRASVDALFHAGRRVEAARLYRRALQPGIAAYRPAVLWAWHPWRSRSASSSSGVPSATAVSTTTEIEALAEMGSEAAELDARDRRLPFRSKEVARLPNVRTRHAWLQFGLLSPPQIMTYRWGLARDILRKLHSQHLRLRSCLLRLLRF